ncbi:hypothetical protein BKG95_03865 [Rodentibacter pneumotropicus]|uniref:Intracellular septation protein A n=1 Tax=Rodentibacter pneumotropicus TaxID=758 RepID=A0AAW5LC58_9PAST|nr:hypothetical protein [Rodentibacter pneumotropicus]MCQ9121650.1 hypothetical protein [Rodentibacter pneumotropicus]OOF68545.1 hypothetical protein BKG95_03865 [Rodentibacter pneumotropicus]
MKINFTQVLQDSWNFFRNQQKIMLQLVLILFMIQVLSILLSPSINSQEALVDTNTFDMANIDVIGFLTSFSIAQLATTFLSAWGLLTIHKISQQNYRTLGQTFSATLSRFIGVVILELIVVIPIFLGLFEIGAAVLTKTSPSIISLVAVIFGIWFFIRVNLSTTHYLTTQDGIGQSLQKIWLQGRTQKSALFIYSLLVYFVVPTLVFQLTTLSNNMIFILIVSGFASLLNILMLVVTYRFYSLFMKES